MRTDNVIDNMTRLSQSATRYKRITACIELGHACTRACAHTCPTKSSHGMDIAERLLVFRVTKKLEDAFDPC